MRVVYFDPDEVWKYFRENHERKCIAEDTTFDVQAYARNQNGTITLTVESEGKIDECFSVSTEEECKEAVENIYEFYIYDVDNPEEDFDEGESESEDDVISDREDQLFYAVYDFLNVVAEEEDLDCDDGQELIRRVLEDILEYLYKKYRLKIRRPMFLEDGGGNEVFVEYPYGYMNTESGI